MQETKTSIRRGGDDFFVVLVFLQIQIKAQFIEGT